MDFRPAVTTVLGVGVFFGTVVLAARAQKTIQVPGDVSTVQAAIDISSNGDTVNIAPGIYPETINFHGKSITVQGNAQGVILKGSQNGPVVTFNSGETRSAVLQNVTVTNGSALAGPSAGGIFISNASPTIQNSTIQDNKLSGIGVFNGAPYLLNNKISGSIFDPNVDNCISIHSLYGGGILLCGASNQGLEAQIVGNIIEDNQAIFGSAGINVISAGQPFIENNTIRGNVTNDRGAGIYVEGDTAPLILQNLIYSNTINPTLIAPAYADVGAGLNVDVTTGQFASSPILIVNNTIVENELLLVPGARSQGSQVFMYGRSEGIQFANNLIVGTTSQSAIDCYQDPTTPVAPPSFDHNDVYDLSYPGVAVYSGTCSNQTGISGNISADPLFASDATDPNPFQLSLSSPAVDAGNNQAAALPTLDILGQPRIQNAKGLSTAIVDIGVYEYSGVPATPPPPVSFTLTVTPSSATIATKQNANLSVKVTPTAANLGTVIFTCIGLPANASCVFSPSTMSFTTASAQSSNLTISIVTAQSKISGYLPTDGSLSMTLAGLTFFPFVWVFRRGHSKKPTSKVLRLAGLLGAVCLTLGLSGCTNIYTNATPAYHLVVQATSVNSAISQQAPVTLTVH